MVTCEFWDVSLLYFCTDVKGTAEKFKKKKWLRAFHAKEQKDTAKFQLEKTNIQYSNHFSHLKSKQYIFTLSKMN